MENLIGKNMDELREVSSNMGLKPYLAKQLSDWLYNKQIDNIADMSNISLKNREALSEKYKIEKIKPIETQESKDGTKKYLYKYDSSSYIESVMIPDKDRVTLCVSTQVGCKMNCEFCATGKQGFGRNLTVAEILNQVITLPELDRLTNIVYMGMGEPFDNYDNLIKSIEILTSDWGFALSPRRITVSTSGILNGIKSFIKDTEAHLAISLHNPFHTERERIMPIEKANNIYNIVEELSKHDWSGQRRLSFEYILWKGLNDSLAHQSELARLIGGLNARVNLIRFHTIPGTEFQGSSDQDMERFRGALSSRGIITTIRASRGEDILAACGLLSTKVKGE